MRVKVSQILYIMEKTYIFAHADLEILVLNHEKLQHVMNVSDIYCFLLSKVLVDTGQEMEHFGVFVVHVHHGNYALETLVIEKVQYNRINEPQSLSIGNALKLSL